MELEPEFLLRLYPGYDSVLGPYPRPDGRQHVVLNNSTAIAGEKGKTKTISYPKALAEHLIGRRLKPNETIDHNDRDKTNDSGRNLVIRDRAEHSSLDALRVKVEDVCCVECGATFTPSRDQHNGRAETKAGPFCSRRCSGTYGARVQNGGQVIERISVEKEYYRTDK